MAVSWRVSEVFLGQVVVATMCSLFVAASGSVPQVKVQGVVGGIAILPCNFTHPSNGVTLDVDWTKEGLSPETVFMKRNSCELYKEKNPDYEFRTNHFEKEWKNNNGSLRLSDLRLEDTGTYWCVCLWDGVERHRTKVELEVEATPPATTYLVPLLVTFVALFAASIFVMGWQRWTIREQARIIESQDRGGKYDRPARRPEQESESVQMLDKEKSSVRPADMDPEEGSADRHCSETADPQHLDTVYGPLPLPVREVGPDSEAPSTQWQESAQSQTHTNSYTLLELHDADSSE